MSEPQYVYANMAIGDEETMQIKAYFVTRLWRENMSQPELICSTENKVNTELVSDALNASIGLTNEQAAELMATWAAEEIAKNESV